MEKFTELFPEIEPYDQGFMYPDDGHAIYYEQSGNPNGKPILGIHGGPGSGSSPRDRRYTDPEKWRLILFDQRGCGRSRPAGELWNNTTWHLIRDIDNLLKQLKVEKTALLAWSWGATLAFAYAISYKEAVSGISSGGIFLGTEWEMDYCFKGYTSSPEAWESFIGLPERDDPIKHYYHEMKSPNLYRRRYFAEKWAIFELSLLYPELPPEELKKIIGEFKYEPALIEAHYFANNCFLEENYILKNTDRLKGIPVSIVHGQDDKVCPPLSAYKLHKALPQSKYSPVKAGHSRRDPENMKKFLIETDNLFDQI